MNLMPRHKPDNLFSVYSILFGMVLVLFTCTRQVAGPATEETNPTVAGTVFTPSKLPASFTKVLIYKKADNLDSVAPFQPALPEAVTTADEKGYFEIDGLTSGEFLLEAQGAGENGYAVINDVTVLSWNTAIRYDSIFLSKPGIICGHATRGGIRGYLTNNMMNDGFIDVFIKDINRHVTTGLQGNYEFTNIPPGTYTLIFRADDGFFTSFKDSVIVQESSVTLVDKILLKRIPWLPPPKPFDLTITSSGNPGEVKLTWKAYNTSDLVGFEVERRINPLQTDALFTVKDPFFFDDISGLPSGIVVYYVVRSISDSFMASANEGPVSITTRQEAGL